MTAAAQAREGWDALALGNWAAARRSFQASLAAGRRPEGWEGLAWACFWLLDVDELLRARAEAYRLYLRRSDVYGAVSAATWRANDVAAALSGNFRELWAIAWSWCFVIYACERVHDYDRAVQWCERSRRVGIDFAWASCRGSPRRGARLEGGVGGGGMRALRGRA